MRALLLQLASEGRKLLHPVTAVAIVASTVTICVLQSMKGTRAYPGPSVADLAGCMRIASLQYATTFGFVVGGVAAAMNTADELSSGSINDALLREPRRLRLALLKCGAVFIVLVGAWGLAVASLAITGRVLRAEGTRFAAVSHSNVAATAIDAGTGVLSFVFIATFAVTIAFLTRSQVTTLILVPAMFVIPLGILSDRIFWAWPTRWTVEWLHLDPFGSGVDYLADISPYDRRGFPAVAGGCALLASSVLFIAVSGRLLDRAALLTGERA